MENFFITEYFDWRLAARSRKIRMANKLLTLLGRAARLRSTYDTGLMTNVEQRMNMYHLLSQVLVYGVPGDVVELVCNEGQSSVLMRKIMDHYAPERQLHVYDSFEGLPKLHQKDGQTPYRAGELMTSKEILVANFEKYGLRLPIIHEGWFSDILPDGLPEEICFAHLDGDLYESILVSLRFVYPKLPKGAICLIDDYADPAIHNGWNLLPGVKAACDDFLRDKPEQVSLIYAGTYSHGFF